MEPGPLGTQRVSKRTLGARRQQSTKGSSPLRARTCPLSSETSPSSQLQESHLPLSRSIELDPHAWPKRRLLQALGVSCVFMQSRVCMLMRSNGIVHLGVLIYLKIKLK